MPRMLTCVHEHVDLAVRGSLIEAGAGHGARRGVQVVTLLADLDDEMTGGTYIDSSGDTQTTAALAGGLARAAASANAVSNAVLTGDISVRATSHKTGGAPAASRASTAFHSVTSIERSAPGTASGSGAGGALNMPRRPRPPPAVRPHRAAVRAVLSSPCNPIPEHGHAAMPPLPRPSIESPAKPSAAASSGPSTQ